MALKPRKMIFLQTIKENCEEKEKLRNQGYFNLDDAIADIKREMTDLLSTSKKSTLCSVEREDIQKYIQERISYLMDKKTEFIELRNNLSETD